MDRTSVRAFPSPGLCAGLQSVHLVAGKGRAASDRLRRRGVIERDALVGAGQAPQPHPSYGGRPWNTEATGDVGPARRQAVGNIRIRDRASRPDPPAGGFKGVQARTASGRHASG